MPIGAALAGKRFFVTGATGFLGTALVERIMRTLPDATVVALVRPSRRSSAQARARREVLRNDCFDRLRHELGNDFDQAVTPRLVAVPGDVSQDGLGLDEAGLRLLASCDVVVHAAATVSFDAPLDQAIEINLLGPSRVAQTLAAARAQAFAPPSPERPSPERPAPERPSPERPPGAGDPDDLLAIPAPPDEVHLISVSTAYVAGTHQGEAREELLSDNRFSLDVDWHGEVDHARRLRADLDAASRAPETLAQLAKLAREELGAAGAHLLAARAERLREDWVKDRLVEAGTARAQSLGWPDAYPFTKALGERALADLAEVPFTVVRPSIIESALAEPVPGWIRGFRMAEPIIISFARGLLREFPGVPEGVIDVIPVDMVVAAILAVAGGGPPARPSVYQVASGVANPLRYGRLVELIQEWFSEHPIYDDRGQPISLPQWSFPGRGRVQRQLKRATAAMDAVERLVGGLPLRGRHAAIAASVEERNTLAKRALSYVELYGAYTETEARYRVDRLLELWESLGAEDQRAFCFDPRAVDWDHYVHSIHLPSVVTHARVRTTPGRSTLASRPERARRAILSPDRHLAAFDLEHTLIAANVVDSYAWLASRHLPAQRRPGFVAELVAKGPSLLALDRKDRGDFLRLFYRRYEGARVSRLEEDAWELFFDHLLPRAFPAGIARVRAHRRLGHRTLLITGALDFVVAPLRPLFDDIVCARMAQEDGRFTGRLDELPPIGEARALLLADYAQEHGFSLEESVAYADSASDLAMLEAVGFPVAVNPESRLAAIARRRGWHVEHWPKASGGAERPLPLGPLDVARPGRAPAIWGSP